ncbi:MAG: hypothetical protein ACE37F_08610 [Nannocystaceae bacterium]|nr:hypothetical protein [bacterium]
MSEYRVALRHTTLLESAALQDLGDDRWFIATAAPPPTSSILTLHEGETEKFFLVDKVFEVESEGQLRGVVGTLTDAQAHEEASMLGTEQLEDGEAPDEVAPTMPVPAPVLADGDDEDPDEAERQRLEADAPSSEDDEADADDDESDEQS